MKCKNCDEYHDPDEHRIDENGTDGCNACIGQCNHCNKFILNENGRYLDDNTWMCVSCIKKKFNL